MYQTFYGFAEKPFSMTPDPQFFFPSDDHAEAMEHLLYGLMEGEGFLLLCGAVGTGKTTLSRALVERLGGQIVPALILNPFQDFRQLLLGMLWDFGVIPEEDGGEGALLVQLQDFLLTQIGPRGQTALVVIDEAQNLPLEVLERLRVISNLETDKEKLLQILLLGQEELLVKLEQPALRQLKQRIAVRYLLGPLKRREIGLYLARRLEAARPQQLPRFSRGAVREVWRFSRGVPRLINMIASRSLLAGFVAGSCAIDGKMVRRARTSLDGEKSRWIKALCRREPPVAPQEGQSESDS